MNKIDYHALREKAEKATCGEWSIEYGEGRFDGDDALIHREVAGYIPICRIEGAHPESGFDEDFQMEQQANAEFIAAANPATVLALLDERERNQQYIKSRDQENEEIALTVGRLLIENGQLVADTLRHLADNEIDSDYFAITSTNENGTEIDHEMSITDYALQAAGTVDELVAALEAAKSKLNEQREYYEGVISDGSKRIAELEKSEEQLINERDHAESALADMYFAATGNRPEWSNWFGFSDAVDAVVDRIADLEAKQPSPVVPDNASGSLAYAYKELTPEIMRNHLAVFERYGIAPNDSSTTIQALRIALDGIERSDAMLQSGNFRENKNSSTNNFREIAETSTNYPVIPSEVLSAILKVAKIRADFDDFDGDRRGIGDCLDEAEQELIVTINKYASQLAVVPVGLDERAAFNAWNNDKNLPIAGVSAKNAAWLAWQARAELGRSLAVNSPVIPDSWISCSERMPDTKTAVLVAVEFDRKGDWRMKWATYIPGHPDANDGWIIPGASWKPSHWMPLPEPPQEVK